MRIFHERGIYMNLKLDNYDNIAIQILNTDKKIVIYGAGMIGTVLVPYLIEKYKLYDNLLFYIDGDKRKQGKTIKIGEESYTIKNIEELKKLSSDTVILITNSNCYPIVQMLDKISELDKTSVYIIPYIQIYESQKKENEKKNIKRSLKPLIPKTIHYCWFSRKPIPEYLLRCIDSWHQYCPDYEIIQWNEDNYDINKYLYSKQAYREKKWGFVPDVIRLDLLYNYGGIYLDTDVELIKSIEELRYQGAFMGVEKWGNINMGGGSGAIPHHPVIKKMLDYRMEVRFLLEDGSYNEMTCGYYETKPLMELGMKPNNTIQNIGDVTIYSSDFFHPFDYMSGETDITDNTFSIHHFNGDWLDDRKVMERKKKLEQYEYL